MVLLVELVMVDFGERVVVRHLELTDRVAALKREAQHWLQATYNVRGDDLVLLVGDPPYKSADGYSRLSTMFSSSHTAQLLYCFLKTDTRVMSRTLQRCRATLESWRGASPSGDVLSACKLDCLNCIDELRVQSNGLKVAVENMRYISEMSEKGFQQLKAKVGSYHDDFTGLKETLGTELLPKLKLVQVPERLLPKDAQNKFETLLDCVKLDSLYGWISEAERMDTLIAGKMSELDMHFGNMTGASSSLDQVLSSSSSSTGDWQVNISKEADALYDAVERFVPGGDSCMMLELLEKCITKRKELDDLYSIAISKISKAQSILYDFEKRVGKLENMLKGQRDILQSIKTVENLPDAFHASLKEIKRRKEFHRQYEEKMREFAEEIANLCEQESENRHEFWSKHGKILPAGLIPSLSELNIPPCEVVQRPFDQLLPDVVDEN